MITFVKIITFVIAAGGLGLVLLFGVDGAYQERIHENAFHCTDDCGVGIFTSASSHQAAGDTLRSGWTWDKIELTRRNHVSIFFVLWLGLGATIFLLLFFRELKNRVRNHINSTAPPSSLAVI